MANPRLRRMANDFEKVQTEFIGHPYIDVEAIQGNPPEKYRVTYKVKGIVELDRRNQPVISERHVAILYLHSDYPRSKPKCNLETPIWHPNFGPYICIGDHWGAGETLMDVIVQIGDMIQYRSYNPKSPLNGPAAMWARENKNLFPIGNIDLYQPEEVIDFIGGQSTGTGAVEDDLLIEFGVPTREDDNDLDIQLG